MTTVIPPCFVYILKLNNGKHYTGLTQNIIIRIRQHEKGQSKSTRWHRPLFLIWATEVKDRKTARRLEVRIKHQGARMFLLRQQYKPNRMHKNIL